MVIKTDSERKYTNRASAFIDSLSTVFASLSSTASLPVLFKHCFISRCCIQQWQQYLGKSVALLYNLLSRPTNAADVMTSE